MKGKRHAAKLTEKQVIEIRRKYIPYKYPAQKLANDYKVKIWAIQDIVRYKTWKI